MSARSLASSTDSIAERLVEQMLHRYRRRTSPAEVRSWQRSIPVVAQDLTDAGLDDVEVILEYQLPLTSKRADVVLAGAHPRTGLPSYVVVELKQWSSAHLWEDDENLILVDGMPGGPKLHPARQVSGYCEYIVDFARAVNGDDAVAGAAYLHNVHDRRAVSDLYELSMDRTGRLFTGADRADFLDFLRSRLAADVSGAQAADQLLGSAIAPSRQLLAVAAEEVREREQFVLLAEQQQAVDTVLHAVERSRAGDRKSVIVITGGPGSGKSVIALSLLGELARQGRTVLHATGSRSFTTTLRKVAGRRAPRVQKLFTYFNQFMEADRNGIDVLIMDEAHRIRETSVNRYTRAALRGDPRPQIDELIAAARVPVFLLDEHQVVRPGESGSVESVEAYARGLGHDVHRITLDEQYRCGGSLVYVEWVERLLNLRADGPTVWAGDDRFELRVADSPAELEATTRAMAEREGFSARLSAGYCWPWSDPTRDGRLVADVQIGDWAMPWNSKAAGYVGSAPPSALWSTDPGGIDQVGCVYTAQGFEYDWNSVIIGPDLLWRDGRFVSVRSQNKDPDFRSTSRVSDSDFDALVRNVYKVLLTRGMIGTTIYSTDAETRAALRRLIG